MGGSDSPHSLPQKGGTMAQRYRLCVFAVCVLGACALQGCKTNGDGQGASPERYMGALRAAVTAGVVVVLDKHPDVAQGMYDVARALAEDTQEEYTSVALVMAQVRSRIQARPTFQARAPAQRAIILGLVETMEQQIGVFLQRYGLDLQASVQTYMQEIAGWIRDIAFMYVPEKA